MHSGAAIFLCVFWGGGFLVFFFLFASSVISVTHQYKYILGTGTRNSLFILKQLLQSLTLTVGREADTIQGAVVESVEHGPRVRDIVS